MEVTNGVRATFCLFQISKGPMALIFSIIPLKKDPKKDPGGSVNSQEILLQSYCSALSLQLILYSMDGNIYYGRIGTNVFKYI